MTALSILSLLNIKAGILFEQKSKHPQIRSLSITKCETSFQTCGLRASIRIAFAWSQLFLDPLKVSLTFLVNKLLQEKKFKSNYTRQIDGKIQTKNM